MSELEEYQNGYEKGSSCAIRGYRRFLYLMGRFVNRDYTRGYHHGFTDGEERAIKLGIVKRYVYVGT